jgi:hypothetical protein
MHERLTCIPLPKATNHEQVQKAVELVKGKHMNHDLLKKSPAGRVDQIDSGCGV